MKGYAEFAMRGPMQAAAAAALPTASLFLSWLGAAVVALSVLRHGIGRSTIVIVAALLPAAFWMQAGDIGPLTTIVCVVGLALVLRLGKSWSTVLLMLPIIVGAWCAAMIFALPEYVELVRLVFEELLQRFQERLASSMSEAELQKLPALTAPDGVQVVGMIAIMQSITVAFSLLVARWWQAMLYNPGGFREEFHALRLQRF
ncbi:MAG: hypothetical protein HKO07_01350, partial [Pseudomonadales bacterium]|nr:hypothetical protein [Pseudomonadales bacterium]